MNRALPERKMGLSGWKAPGVAANRTAITAAATVAAAAVIHGFPANRETAHATRNVDTTSADMSNLGSFQRTPPHVMRITGKLRVRESTQKAVARVRRRQTRVGASQPSSSVPNPAKPPHVAMMMPVHVTAP